MPGQCVALGCSKRGDFFFPTDKKRRLQWMIAVRRKGEKSDLWKPTKHSKLCWNHFTPEDFMPKTEFRTNRKLKTNAVPSVFIHSKMKSDDCRKKRLENRRQAKINIDYVFGIIIGRPNRK